METLESIHTEQVDALLQQQINAGKTPGLYYAFFNAGEMLHEFTGGKADLKSETPVTPQTAFHGYSVTKIFTATAVMQLAEQGKLNLDEPVKTYLPDFIYGDGILVRHLLAHSGGLPNPLPISWIHLAEEHADFDGNAFFQTVFQKNPKSRSAPNDKFAYTNLGYVALGQLIEQVSGLTYSRFMEQNILAPLGLSEHLGFTRQNHWKVATGYHKALSFGNFLLSFLLDKKRFMGEATDGWKRFLPIYLNGAAYGGLIGEPGAFIAFAQSLLKPESKLLSPESKQVMWQENILNNGKASGMSLGWFKGNLAGQSFAHHAGGGGGFYCELRVYPESGFGSAVFMNRSGFSDARFLDKTDTAFLQGR
jgi:CubicO group peptidase (beta-lactamase class C family)